MTKATKRKHELRGKARLRSEIVEIPRALHKVGVVSDADLEETTLRMLGKDCLYTDLRNPFSNRCYAKIGFVPHCESW